jgi:hypothetical protein
MIHITCAKCDKSFYTSGGGVFKASCLCSTSLNKKDEETPVCIKCPVCEGKGHLPLNFYGNSVPVWGEGYSGTVTWTVGIGSVTQCRSCNGKGVLWKA